MCYSRLGEFERAVATQRRSVSLHTNRGTRTDYEHALGELGHTFMQKGDSRLALPYLRQALEVATESNLQADAALWAGNLAAANVNLGEWDEAERFNDEAKRLKAASRSGNLFYNTLNAAQIAQGRGRLDEATRLFSEALAGAQSNPDVRWAAHAGLAGIAVARSQPAEAARQFEAALDTIEKTRSELLKTEYKLSFLTRLIQFYQSYVDALVDQGRVERALEVSDSSRGRVLAERNGLTPLTKAGAAEMRQLAARSRPVVLVGRHRGRHQHADAASGQRDRRTSEAIPDDGQQRPGRSSRTRRHGRRSAVPDARRARVAVDSFRLARRHRR